MSTQQQQVADLLNNHSRLARSYAAEEIDIDRYILETDGEEVVGCVKWNKPTWYQAEISHLVVDPACRRKGVGTELVRRALEAAKEDEARVAQCTIRNDNYPSLNLFGSAGFRSPLQFEGLSGSLVSLWLRVL